MSTPVDAPIATFARRDRKGVYGILPAEFDRDWRLWGLEVDPVE